MNERFDQDFSMVFEQQKDIEEREQKAVDLIIKSRRFGLTLAESFELAEAVGIDKRLVE